MTHVTYVHYHPQVREVHGQILPNYPIYSCSLAPQNLDCRSTGTGLQRVVCGGGGNTSGPLNPAWLFDLQWEVIEDSSKSISDRSVTASDASRSRVCDEDSGDEDDEDDDNAMDCDAVAI